MAIIRGRSREARLREWAAQHRLRAGLERRAARDLAKEIRRAGEAAALGFEEGRHQGIFIALLDHGERVGGILRPHYQRVFDAFGGRLIDGTRGAWVHETRDTESFFTQLTLAWLEEFGALQIQRVSDTTLRQIVEAALSGEEAGEGVAAIAKRITGITSGTIGRTRALVIARTETHNASTAAQDSALDALDLPEVQREWLSAEDERTRPTHVRADGQIRNQNEAFDVGGVKMMRPGDPSAPPREIINCRCIAAAVVPD